MSRLTYWAEQPQYTVALSGDFSDALLAYIPSIDLLGDIRAVSPTTYGGSYQAGHGPGGVYFWKASFPAEYIDFAPPIATGVLTQATLIAVQRHPNVASANYGWHDFDSDTQLNHWSFSGGLYLSTFSSSRWVNGTAYPTEDGSPYVVAIVADGTSRKMYVRGQLFTSNTSDATVQWSNFRVGQNDGSYGPDFETYALFILPRALSDAEIVDIASPADLYRRALAPSVTPIAAILSDGVTPILSAATVFNIANTTATPRVTVTF